MKSGSRKGWLTRVLCGCICVALMCAAAPALADPQAAPVSAQSTSLSGTVRVYLSSLSANTSLTLTVDGVYSINGDNSRALTRGGTVKVSYESEQLYLTVSGNKQSMGTQFFLRRHQSSGMNGIKISQAASPSNWYNGDLEFAVRNGRMYPIVHVYMEDYIHGVLPYEMGSSFPLEALKAQAVAARTYTVQAMNKRAAYYDVVDTTTDQVYRGVSSDNSRYEQAAGETAGIVAMYNGQYVGGYYTASNGGQTEAVKNAWGNTSYPYLDVQDDPYDYANISSVVKSFVIYGNGSSLGALDSALKSKVASKMSAQGVSTTAGSVNIEGISAVVAHSPKYASPSRLYTMVDMTVSAWPSAARNGSAATVTVTFDYFSELESLLGLSINSTKNELVAVESGGNNFILTARRYGHGIGMSQRGAQQMANMGMSYQQIIGFYYPGCNLVKYSFSDGTMGGIDEGGIAVVTPQPQLPVDGNESAATVSLSNPAGWLNLRESPSTGAPILAQLMHGQQLRVLTSDGVWCQVKYGELTGYVMRDYLAFSGGDDPGVSPDDTPTPAPEDGATPTPTVNGAQYQVMVLLQDYGSKLNMRSAPSTSAGILARLSHGAVLEVLGEEGQWLRVRYGFSEGYVMASYTIRVSESQTDAPTPEPTPDPNGSDETPAPSPSPSPSQDGGWATVSVSSGTTLNLRLEPNTFSSVLSRMPNGVQVQWKPVNDIWAQVDYNGMQGYAMRVYLLMQDDPAQSTPTPAVPGEETPSPSPGGQAQSKSAIVNLSSSSAKLNLRASAGTSGKVIATIPHGAIVELVSYGVNWCAVKYLGLSGYLSTLYLLFPGDIGTVAPTTPPAATEPPSGSLTELIVISTSLNLRASASTASKRLVELPNGARLIQLEQLTGWYKVRWTTLEGYVSASYVQPLGSPTSTSVVSATQTPPPAATAAPTASQPPLPPTPSPSSEGQSTVGKPINSGVVTPLEGAAFIEAYKDFKDAVPVAQIPTGERLDVLAYAGENAEWCEVLYYDAVCYVLTAGLKLDRVIIL